MKKRPKIRKEHKKKLSRKALKRWQDPVFRNRLSAAMSAGALKRWADKKKREELLIARSNPESKRKNAEGLSKAHCRRAAEAFGISPRKWAAMSKGERFKYSAEHPKLKVMRNCANTAMWAKRLKMPYEKFAKLSGIDKKKLKIVWKKNNGNR